MLSSADNFTLQTFALLGISRLRLRLLRYTHRAPPTLLLLPLLLLE